MWHVRGEGKCTQGFELGSLKGHHLYDIGADVAETGRQDGSGLVWLRTET